MSNAAGIRYPVVQDRKAFFFDLDGCVYYTNVLAEGADTLIARLKQDGKNVGFITNNSRQSAVEVAAKLIGMGLDVAPHDILTATECTGKYLADTYGASRVKVVGSLALSEAMSNVGHQVLPLFSSDYADFIVVGRDTEFSYEKLAWIAREADKGTQVISANPDLVHPGSEGERVPETGALIAAIEAVTGTKAEHIGKPGPSLFRYGMEMFGVEAGDSVMVGDNYFTDIIGGKGVGMYTIWINADSKETSFTPNADRPDADVSVPHIRSIYELLYTS